MPPLGSQTLPENISVYNPPAYIRLTLRGLRNVLLVLSRRISMDTIILQSLTATLSEISALKLHIRVVNDAVDASQGSRF